MPAEMIKAMDHYDFTLDRCSCIDQDYIVVQVQTMQWSKL